MGAKEEKVVTTWRMRGENLCRFYNEVVHEPDKTRASINKNLGNGEDSTTEKVFEFLEKFKK